MEGIYKCLWCNELFVEIVPQAIAGNILPQYHDPCPKQSSLMSLALDHRKIIGATQLLAIMKEE